MYLIRAREGTRVIQQLTLASVGDKSRRLTNITGPCGMARVTNGFRAGSGQCLD